MEYSLINVFFGFLQHYVFRNGIYPLTAYSMPAPGPLGGSSMSSGGGSSGTTHHAGDSRVLSPADHQLLSSGVPGGGGPCDSLTAGGSGTSTHLGDDAGLLAPGEEAGANGAPSYVETRRVTAMSSEAKPINGTDVNGNGAAILCAVRFFSQNFIMLVYFCREYL